MSSVAPPLPPTASPISAWLRFSAMLLPHLRARRAGRLAAGEPVFHAAIDPHTGEAVQAAERGVLLCCLLAVCLICSAAEP